MFEGCITALATPLNNNEVDLDAFQKFVDWQVNEGIDGVVVCGATGEASTLHYDEREKLIRACLEAVNKRVPVMVGAGSNATDICIKYSKQSEQLGADAVLVTVPYYNKPTQEGLYQHYKAVNDTIGIPIYIYNVPGRTSVNIADETIANLAKLKNIKGIKDATSDLTRPLKLKLLLESTNFIQLTGEDATAVAFNASGGNGIISVTSNVAPRLCVKVQKLTQGGNYKEAMNLHQKLFPLHNAMFCETNPGPVKYSLSLLGKFKPEIRLPLVLPRPESQQLIKNAMQQVGLI